MNKSLALVLALSFAATSFAQSNNSVQPAPATVVSQPLPPAVAGRAMLTEQAPVAAPAKAAIKKVKHAKKSKNAGKHPARKLSAAKHAKFKAHAAHKLHG